MHNFTKGMRVKDIGYSYDDFGTVVKVEGPYVHVQFDEPTIDNEVLFHVFEEGIDLRFLEEIK